MLHIPNYLATLISVVALTCVIGLLKHQWNEWCTDWERLLVALLEVAALLYLIERVDGWVRLLVGQGVTQ